MSQLPKETHQNLPTVLSKSLTQVKGMVVFEIIWEDRIEDIQSKTECFNGDRKKRKEKSGYYRFSYREKNISERENNEQWAEGTWLSNSRFASPLPHLPGISSPSILNPLFLFYQGNALKWSIQGAEVRERKSVIEKRKEPVRVSEWTGYSWGQWGLSFAGDLLGKTCKIVSSRDWEAGMFIYPFPASLVEGYSWVCGIPGTSRLSCLWLGKPQ